MGTNFDITAATPVLKQRYTKKKILTLAYTDQPFWAAVSKNESGGGISYNVPMRNALPQTRSAAFANSQASFAQAGGSSVYNNFAVTYKEDYATANITGQAIDRANGDMNALVDVLTNEIDGALLTAGRSLGISMFRNGGGARGQISAGSTVGSTTITLANPTDVTNFEVGMALQLSAADGTSGAVRAGQVFVQAIDRDLGTLTASTTLGGAAANWTAGVAAAAASDYIFQYGDFGAMFTGVAGWVPAVAPTSTLFFGVDRSTDATRLGGVRFPGNGAPFEETLIDAAARLGREGAKVDNTYVNPLDYASLVKALGAKVIYDRSTAFDMPEIGWEAVKLTGPKGPIKVISDVNVPKGTAYMMTMSTWEFVSMGGAPKIINLDGNKMLRQATADAYEVRIVTRGNLTCCAPGWNAVITF